MKHRILAPLLAAAVLLLGGCRGGAPAESAPESAAPTVWRYAALGDSIPAGYGLADGEKSYPERLRDQIGAAYDRVEFSNFAVSGYTTAQLEAQVSALLTGVNLGGLGTLIASLASLISFKFFSREYPDRTGTFLKEFTIWNLAFLIVLTAAAFLIRIEILRFLKGK